MVTTAPNSSRKTGLYSGSGDPPYCRWKRTTSWTGVHFVLYVSNDNRKVQRVPSLPALWARSVLQANWPLTCLRPERLLVCSRADTVYDVAATANPHENRLRLLLVRTTRLRIDRCDWCLSLIKLEEKRRQGLQYFRHDVLSNRFRIDDMLH